MFLFRDSGHILTFGSLQASDSGLYTCNAQNIIGSVSTEFNLQVNYIIITGSVPAKKNGGFWISDPLRIVHFAGP